MTRLLSRTSITIDEAISSLLGRSAGPIDYEPTEPTDEAADDTLVFCLREALEDELEVLAGEYELAKHEERSPEFIAEKQAAVEHQEAVIEQANLYLCAIQDELNRGEQSVLKVDSASSNAAYTFITLHSFNEWRKRLAGDESGGEEPTESVRVSSKVAEKKAPRKKQRDQEDAILEQILKLGLDPLALPPDRYGRDGVKKDVRVALKSAPLFQGSTIFDKAWERLRKQDRIRKERGPYSPKKDVGGDL